MALDGLDDGTVSVSQVVGRLSVLLFGYAVGNYIVAGITATFFPVVTAVIAALFIATLTITLALFSILCFSYNSIRFNRPKQYLA